MKQTENNVNMGPVKNPELEKVITELKEGSTPEKQVALIEAAADQVLSAEYQ